MLGPACAENVHSDFSKHAHAEQAAAERNEKEHCLIFLTKSDSLGK